jgi:HK97 family phage major capsid protein
MNINVKKDQQKLGELHDAMTKIVGDAESAGRNMSADENAKFDSLMEEHTNLEKEVERKMKLQGITKQDVEKVEELAERKGESVDQVRDYKEASKGAYLSYLRNGFHGMSQKEIEIMKRAQSSGTDSEGGFTVDEMIADEIVKTMAYYGGMRDVCNVLVDH